MSETYIQDGFSGDQIQPTIFRVPSHIKDNKELEKTDFEPKFVSIGPYFHGRKNLRNTEKQKAQFALELEQNLEKKEKNIIGALVVEFTPLESQARSCYDGGINPRLNGNKFLHMLALDCCFIIQLMISIIGDMDTFHGFNIRDLRSDLLLLENQIPLFILQVAYNLISKISISELHPFEELLVRFLFLGMAWRPNDFNICVQDHHLLHSFWRRIWPHDCSLEHTPKFLSKRTSFHLRSQDERVLQTATVLYQTAGIVFTNQNNVKGIDISFKNGRVKMPCLKLSLNKRKLLLNLIAYENFMDHPHRICMSYMLLMDAFIHEDQDVALLQKQGVLNNKLLHNDTAATFFNVVGNLCSVNHRDNFFKNFIEEVDDYYESPSKRQLANFRRKYCSSPWAFISLVAGSALLLMSFFQTYYTIYGYYHPRN